MAGRFNTNIARESDGSPSTMRLVGRNDSPKYFAIGGEATPGQTPRFGLLVRASDQSVVALGVLFQPVTTSERKWGMVFTVDPTELLSGGPYSLHIKSSFDDPSPDRIDGLTFGHGIVSVLYPTGGTVCAGSVVAYGSFSGADTQVNMVELLNAGGMTEQTDSSPYYNSKGFWASTLSGLVASNSYSVRATGNANTGTGGTFSAVTC